MMRRYSSFLVWILALAILLMSCEKPSDELPLLSDNDRLTRTYTLGGAPVEMKVWLSSTEVPLIDYLSVKILVYAKEAVRIEPPFLSESHFQPLALVEQPENQSYWDETSQNMVYEWHYVFEPMESGEFSIKPFSLYFRLDSQKSPDMSKWPVYEILSDDIPYRVIASGIDDLSDIKGIKGPILPPFHVFYPILALIGLMAFLMGYYWWRRYRLTRSVDTPRIETSVDYREEALNAIQMLEEKNLLEDRRFREFHTELSRILRAFIEKRFALNAGKQTTEEFLKAIGDSSLFSTAQKSELQTFLRLSDLVKFASYQPVADVSLEATGTARSLIQSTGVPDEI